MDIKVDASWFRFLADLPAAEIKIIVRAIWEYAQNKKDVKINCAAWETIKASIDADIQHKKEISEKRRAAIAMRWDKKQKEKTETQPIVQNKFVSFTDNQEICDALNNPNSALSVFLDTGSRYDELTVDERNFVDRGDVRALCTWYKKTQAVETVVKKIFTPPTLDEVLEYAREQDSISLCGGFECSDTQAEEFWAHYESQNWRINNESNTPIREWKPKLRQWCLRDKRQQPRKRPGVRMSFKEMKQLANDIQIQKILDGEA